MPKVEGGVSKTVPVIRDGDRVVADSFAIALYLEDAYPDRPTLFGGEGGKAMARFIERWSQLTLHSYNTAAAAVRHPRRPGPLDKVYFRKSREAALGKPLEEVSAGREAGLAAYRASLEPLRSMLAYQPFIGGQSPLFADYIVFGAFQWVRVMSAYGYWPRTIRSPTGSSAASTCMAASAAKCRRRPDRAAPLGNALGGLYRTATSRPIYPKDKTWRSNAPFR